ncbi:BCS1 N terminal-domain-containing protein [Calycina marina]|uniref:BCS1 N terminal-domain-containing protein n=1 Tax=Calycina marina TaxID=1763456 RepID=A0A9P7Z4H1_9HELO|nr:BCS1 N terminal-domain-containing protein [Calycina marina]
MVPSPIRSLLLLARAAFQRLLDNSTPGFTFLRNFFAAWLKLDVTTIAAGLTIFGTITGAFRDLQGVGVKLYWYFTKFFTAAISVAAKDRLSKEVLGWIAANVLERQGTRILTAKCETIETDYWQRCYKTETERNDYFHEKRIPIQYHQIFGPTWFIHSRNLFMVSRISTTRIATNVPEQYAAAPNENEPILVMCLGWSVAPIKRFFEHCRDWSDEQKSVYVTVCASKPGYDRKSWDTTILRPRRPMATVHFDEDEKAVILAGTNSISFDIQNYLESSTRRFYNKRGIPYRRGVYSLIPSATATSLIRTGKTSLSLALAGYFGLELYLLHMPSVREDGELDRLFTALPPRCIDEKEIDEEDEEDDVKRKSSRCTLSGLLNVIDGVASQEGRIVLMTSNMAHKLDAALVRPGRIDRLIFLGNISSRSSELMFLRMYAPDEEALATPDLMFRLSEGELERLALKFGEAVPSGFLTPAQLQGYLLNMRADPRKAAEEISAWVKAEQTKMAEAEIRKEERAERRAKKKREAARKVLKKTVNDAELDSENSDLDVEDELEVLEANEKRKMRKHAELVGKDERSNKDAQDKTRDKPVEKMEKGKASEMMEVEINVVEAVAEVKASMTSKPEKAGNAKVEA